MMFKTGSLPFTFNKSDFKAAGRVFLLTVLASALMFGAKSLGFIETDNAIILGVLPMLSTALTALAQLVSNNAK